MFTKQVTSPRKNGPDVKYVQIVESVRRPGSRTPTHEVILNLGRADKIDRERVAELVRLLSAYLTDEEKNDLPSSVEIGQTREWGVGYVVEALWERFGLDKFFRRELRRRKIASPVERALLAMVMHRAQEPTSKLQDFYWLRNEAFAPWGAKVELQHLYRSLDFLQDNRDVLEKALYGQRRDLLNRSVQLVYFDTTTVHFEIEDDPEEPPVEGLRQYGRPKDGRISHRQIVLGMAVDPDGLPLLSETFAGNTIDTRTIGPVVKRLAAMGVEDVVFVADRGAVSQTNLKAVRKAELHYIVGLRLRNAGDLMPKILKDATAYETIEENLLAKKVVVGGRQVVVCYSPETAERDLKMRGRALERLNPPRRTTVKTARDPQKAEAEVLAHRLFRRWVTRDSKGALVVSREKVATESQCDGTFVLETSNDKLSTAQVALGYKGLLRVERAWHSLKHSIDIQSVFLRKDERIAAHVTLCMITYLLERWAEIRSGSSFRQIRQQLRTLHATELIQGDQRLWKPNRLAPAQQALLKKLEIPPPKPVLHAGRLPRLPADSM